MKKLSGLIAITILVLGCNRGENCTIGSGDIVSEEITVDDFQQISFEVAGNVTLIEAAEQKVVIETHENLIGQVNTSLRDDTWNIRFIRCIRNYDRFNVTIYTPQIKGINLSGSGNITSEGSIPSDGLVVLLSGSGNILHETTTDIITADISGSGNIILSGSIDTQNFAISGSGGINGFNLEGKAGDVTISGSGNCEVNVSETLTVRITGSGSVFYKGDPTLDSTITGSGQVIKAD